MDENNNNNQEPEKVAEKTVEKTEKLSISEYIKAKYIEYKSEFKKIIWPTSKVLYKQTFTVTVVSLLFGLIIFCIDTVYNLGLQLFVSLIG